MRNGHGIQLFERVEIDFVDHHLQEVAKTTMTTFDDVEEEDCLCPTGQSCLRLKPIGTMVNNCAHRPMTLQSFQYIKRLKSKDDCDRKLPI